MAEVNLVGLWEVAKEFRDRDEAQGFRAAAVKPGSIFVCETILKRSNFQAHPCLIVVLQPTSGPGSSKPEWSKDPC